MGVFLIILACLVGLIVALLAFLLLSPLWVRINFDEKLTVRAGLAFVSFKVLPSKKKSKKKQKKKPKNVKNTAEAAPQKPSSDKKLDAKEDASSGVKEQKKPISETLSLVFDIVGEVMKKLGKHARIKIDMLKVSVSSEDAADTAVQYGICCGILTSILGLASTLRRTKIRQKNVGVYMDFLSGKSKGKIDITLSVSPIFPIIGAIKGFLKNNNRK